METLDIHGLRIAYQRSGQGPPLVLLHGAMSDSRSWRKQIDDLADEFTVVAWDAPGCGQSSDPPETFAMDDYADCLAALIESLGLEKPHLLGLSFGSGLALAFYQRYPEMTRSLTLASAYAGWAGSLPAEVVAERLKQFERNAKRPRHQVAAEFVPGVLSDAAPAEMVKELVEQLSDFHPDGTRVMAYAFAEADLRDMLPTIDVPTLLLYGDKDRRSPLKIAEDLHSRIPGSRLVVIPGAGHACNFEAPERFNAEVRQFLGAQS